MDVERRQHWDDELIEAVFRIMANADLRDVYENGYSEDQIFRVIAAVEDWHKAKRASRDRTHSNECWRWHQECAEGLIEAQQARLGELSEQLLWYPDWQVRAGEAGQRAKAAEAERDVLRKTINETEIALHNPWKYNCECCERIGEELGAWGGTPAWQSRALDGDDDE